MPSTSRGYPYPSGSDDVDIPGDIQALADAVNTDVGTIATTTPSAPVLQTLADAAGDLAVGSAADTFGRLALGTDNYALTVNTGGAGVAKIGWEDPTANPLTVTAMALKVNTATVGNLLTANQASGTDTLGTTAGFADQGGGAVPASSTAEAVSGTKSLRITWNGTSANYVEIQGPEINSRFAVTPSSTITIKAMNKGGSDTWAYRVFWYKTDGSASATASTVYPVTAQSASWHAADATFVAPTDAAYMWPLFYRDSGVNGDITYFDNLSVHFGAGGQWALPGTPITNLGFYTDESVGRRLFQWDANNSRFQQTFGDTGWRSVTDLLVNGWLTSADRITIRRQNNVVTLMLGDMDGRSATTDVIMTLPSGFRPNWQYNVPSYATSGATSSRSVNAVHTGNVTWYGTPRPTYENALFTYLTSDAWPTTLPGTAVGSIPA